MCVRAHGRGCVCVRPQTVAKMADMCPASSTLLIYIGSHVHFDALTKQSFLVANDTSRTQVSRSFVLYHRFSSGLVKSAMRFMQV